VNEFQNVMLGDSGVVDEIQYATCLDCGASWDTDGEIDEADAAIELYLDSADEEIDIGPHFDAFGDSGKDWEI